MYYAIEYLSLLSFRRFWLFIVFTLICIMNTYHLSTVSTSGDSGIVIHVNCCCVFVGACQLSEEFSESSKHRINTLHGYSQESLVEVVWGWAWEMEWVSRIFHDRSVLDSM